jgi:NAD(P)-dependent dehydrogenase (short-subunit alcohol dehydrogenase family)
MPSTDISAKTALVTGASRGFGRAIATTLSSEGATVIGVARNAQRLDDLRDELGEGFTGVVGDVCDADVARNLILEWRPEILVLNAGATPVTGPLQQQTWESFSHNWEVDTQHAFNWTRESLRTPLAPGSVVIALSSGAAIGGSPLSGGYSSAKAAIRFISAYAAHESERAEMGIRFTALLPQLTPATDLGAAGASAYAEREGVDVQAFLKRFDPILTLELVGNAVVELCRDEEEEGGETPLAYTLSGAGLRGIV